MKNILLALTLLIAVGTLKAQDKIYFNDGSIIETRVLLVSETVIKYKKFDNLEGPTFEIGLTDINMIVFENGSHQIFNKQIKKVSSSKKKEFGFRKNRINLDLLAIGINGPTSISYEMLNDKGSRGIEIPFSVYFNSGEVSGYTSGVNFKYYVTQGGKGFFVGPSLGLGVFDWYYDEDFSVWLGVKLGYQIQISKLFGINLAGNAGGISNFDDIDFGYSLNLGINFTF